MRAIVINRHGGPEALELEERPTPEPKAGEVLVEATVAGVNYRDVYQRDGRGGHEEPPVVAGGEGAGTVVALGPDVSEVRVGDRVAWTHAAGSYAEEVIVAADRAVPIPDGVSVELAAAVILQGITAHYLSSTTYPVGPGDTVLVHSAAGGTGRLLVQMAKRRGGRVIGTTSTEAKAAIARAAGADEVIVGTTDFAARVRDLTGGEGVAAVYDGVGKTTFDEGLICLRMRGVMVSYGWSSGPVAPLDLVRLLRGSFYVTRPSSSDHTATRSQLLERAGEIFAWAEAGTIDVLIGGRYPLAEAARAHADLESRQTTGKLLLLTR